MKRGDIVEYMFPGLVDAVDADTKIRARAQLISRLALVRSVTATTANIVVLEAEPWESPRFVNAVLFDDGQVHAVNMNQYDDRKTAIHTGTLDSIRDNVKGWVKALV